MVFKNHAIGYSEATKQWNAMLCYASVSGTFLLLLFGCLYFLCEHPWGDGHGHQLLHQKFTGIRYVHLLRISNKVKYRTRKLMKTSTQDYVVFISPEQCQFYSCKLYTRRNFF